MPFTLKARSNYTWAPLPEETFRHFREARARAAALLLARLAGADMIAVCIDDEGKVRAVACLTMGQPRGARATEWPGIREWGPPADAFPEPADAVTDSAAAGS
jgi:hypothetical protein